MTILVVDDDAGIRKLIRRVLADEFGVEIAEADDGLTALQHLLEHRVDIVVLDMWMPIISGLETLETIRRSSDHADVPVVMMSGKADEAGVQRAVRLGVREIIAKPFGPGTLRERFAKIIKEQAEEPPQRQNLLEIQDADTALIVDTSAEFRDLARAELKRVCRVEESPNEFAALSRCLTGGGVDLMVVGETSEMSSTEVFGRKVRGIRQLRGLRLIAAVPEDEPRLTGLYDATIVRSFVAETLRTSLTRVLEPHTLGRMLFHPASPALAEFCDQAGRALGDFVEGAAMHTTAPGLSGESVHIGGAAEVQAQGSGWDVRVTCTNSTSLQIASRLFQKNVDELAESDPAQAVVQLTAIVADRLRDTMSASGLQIKPLHARPSHEMNGPNGSAERSASLCRRWFSVGRQEVATLEIVRLRKKDQADEATSKVGAARKF